MTTLLTFELVKYPTRENSDGLTSYDVHNLEGDYRGTLRLSVDELASLTSQPTGELLKEIERCAGAISRLHGARFMDPPDGGDVALSVQVERMAEALRNAEAPSTTDQDVAALVAVLENWPANGNRQDALSAGYVRGLMLEAATALSTLAAERDAARVGLSKAIDDVVAARLLVDQWSQASTFEHARAEASEARATALEAQIKDAFCILDDWPAVGTDLEKREKIMRRVEALRSPAPADGQGEDDGVASASYLQERIKAPLPKWITDRYGDTPEIRESLEQFARAISNPRADANQKITQTGDRDGTFRLHI